MPADIEEIRRVLGDCPTMKFVRSTGRAYVVDPIEDPDGLYMPFRDEPFEEFTRGWQTPRSGGAVEIWLGYAKSETFGVTEEGRLVQTYHRDAQSVTSKLISYQLDAFDSVEAYTKGPLAVHRRVRSSEGEIWNTMEKGWTITWRPAGLRMARVSTLQEAKNLAGAFALDMPTPAVFAAEKCIPAVFLGAE